MTWLLCGSTRVGKLEHIHPDFVYVTPHPTPRTPHPAPAPRTPPPTCHDVEPEQIGAEELSDLAGPLVDSLNIGVDTREHPGASVVAWAATAVFLAVPRARVADKGRTTPCLRTHHEDLGWVWVWMSHGCTHVYTNKFEVLRNENVLTTHNAYKILICFYVIPTLVPGYCSRARHHIQSTTTHRASPLRSVRRRLSSNIKLLKYSVGTHGYPF